MQGKEIVRAVRVEFPGFDHALYSKALRPERYGIRLIDRAQAIADALNGQAVQKPRKRDRRSKANKYTWRAGNALKQRLQTAKKARGILTDQEAITLAVLAWVEGSERDVQ